MDFLVFTEGRNELANNGLPALCFFLLSTKSVDGTNPHSATETLAASNLGEISGATGYSRKSQTEPTASSGMVNFLVNTWTTGSAQNWPSAVRSIVLVTGSGNSGKAICTWNLAPGGIGRDMSAPNITENIIPTLGVE